MIFYRRKLLLECYQKKENLTFQNSIKRVWFVKHPNSKIPYVNFSSLILPGGKLSKIEENMKIVVNQVVLLPSVSN